MCPGSGNLPEILPYTTPGKVKEMLKFPGVPGKFTFLVHLISYTVGN